MTNLCSEICYAIRDARHAAKLSQSAVAQEVGCKQSALSMFEQGDGTKLNDEVVEKLAKKFKVDISSRKGEATDNIAAMAVHCNIPPEAEVLRNVKGFCPNPHCPSNHAFVVEGRTYYLPNREVADPVGGKFCAMCGEVLEKKCPNCGVPVHTGAVCSICGERYIIT